VTGPPVERVLLVHEIYSGYGGAERYLELLADGLAERGVQVQALVFGVDTSAGQVAADRLAAGPAAVTYLPHRFSPRALRRRLEDFPADVVHWNFADPFSYRGATWLVLPWGRPSVVTDHLPMLRCGRHWESTRALANRRIGAMIVVSQAAVAEARAHWGRPPPIVAVANAGSADVVAVRDRPPAGEPVRLAFVGRLEDQKDPGFALRVLGALVSGGTRATLTVVGDGSLRAALEAGVPASLEDSVTFVGHSKTPWSAVADAHVLLAPSRYEGGFPLVAREALASGLPVVLSDIAPHRELEDPAVRLAPLGEVGPWVQAVGDLVASLPEASQGAIGRFGQAARATMVSETLAAYELALTPAGTRPSATPASPAADLPPR